MTDYSGRVGPDRVMEDRRNRVRETCQMYAGHGVMQPGNPYFATR